MTAAVPVTALVEAAARGDQRAWDGLVERYTPLVMSVVRRFHLPEHDAKDVRQTVWLRLVEHLEEIREPRALPTWLITTTRNECVGWARSTRRTTPFDPLSGSEVADGPDVTPVDDELLREERLHALREGFSQLPPQHRALLALLAADPPLSYAEISRRLDLPIGSIGPTRKRCLQKLRHSPALMTFLDEAGDPDSKGGERHVTATLGR